jgi:chromate reductase
MKILGIVGSLRKESYNRSLMNAFVALKPEGIDVEIADIGILPLYNQDDEADVPEVAQKLKAQVENADAVIIATPEYNRSVPGALKNAIDWLSRPYGKNSFSGKRVLVVGASTGPTGAAMGQYDLKKMLLHGNAEVFGQPEFFLGTAGDKFDASGALTDEKTRGHITGAWARITAE